MVAGQKQPPKDYDSVELELSGYRLPPDSSMSKGAGEKV